MLSRGRCRSRNVVYCRIRRILRGSMTLDDLHRITNIPLRRLVTSIVSPSTLGGTSTAGVSGSISITTGGCGTVRTTALSRLYSSYNDEFNVKTFNCILSTQSLTEACFVNFLNLRLSSVRIGPSRNFSKVITRSSFASWSASSAAVGARGSRGGEIGNSSKTRFLLLTPSGNCDGGLRISFNNVWKNSSR